MNLLILTNHLNTGGISTYVVNASKALAERGYQVIVASRGGDLEDQVPIHVSLQVTGKNAFSWPNLSLIRDLGKVVERYDIDVLWAHTRITMVLSHFYRWFRRIPIVTTYHGFFSYNLGRRLVKACGDKAIAISSAVREHMISHLKIPENKVVLVPNALPSSHLHLLRAKRSAMRSVSKRNLGLPDSAFVVGMLCRINEGKGYHLVVEALKDLPEIWFLMVGKADNRKKVQRVLESSPARGRILWYEDLDGPDLFWSAIDVFLMPSLKEGFGFTLLEALGCGIPCIVSDSGGPPEVVRDGREGLVVPPGDVPSLSLAIQRLYKDRKLYERLSESALRRITDFSFDTFLDRIDLVLKSVLKSH